MPKTTFGFATGNELPAKRHHWSLDIFMVVFHVWFLVHVTSKYHFWSFLSKFFLWKWINSKSEMEENHISILQLRPDFYICCRFFLSVFSLNSKSIEGVAIIVFELHWENQEDKISVFLTVKQQQQELQENKNTAILKKHLIIQKKNYNYNTIMITLRKQLTCYLAQTFYWFIFIYLVYFYLIICMFPGVFCFHEIQVSHKIILFDTDNICMKNENERNRFRSI